MSAASSLKDYAYPVRRLKAILKSEGKCTQCAEPAIDGKTLCIICLEKNRVSVAKLRADRALDIKPHKRKCTKCREYGHNRQNCTKESK